MGSQRSSGIAKGTGIAEHDPAMDNLSKSLFGVTLEPSKAGSSAAKPASTLLWNHPNVVQIAETQSNNTSKPAGSWASVVACFGGSRGNATTQAPRQVILGNHIAQGPVASAPFNHGYNRPARAALTESSQNPAGRNQNYLDCCSLKCYGEDTGDGNDDDDDEFDDGFDSDCCKGLQPLITHAKIKGTNRVKIHRELGRIRGTSDKAAGDFFGKRKAEKDKQIIWPPMVVIMNTQLDKDDKDKNDKWVGMGKQELLNNFAEYTPTKARNAYGPGGHMGMSLLIFDATVVGYMEAKRLNQYFTENGRDRDAWDRRRVPFYPGGDRPLYGYIAEWSDLEIFNKHCQGKSKIKFEVKSYSELLWDKNKFGKEQRHAKALDEEESYEVLSGKPRKTKEVSRPVHQRNNIQGQSLTSIIARSRGRHSIMATESRVSHEISEGVYMKDHDNGEKIFPVSQHLYLAGTGPMEQIDCVNKDFPRDELERNIEGKEFQQIAVEVANDIHSILVKQRIDLLEWSEQSEYMLLGSIGQAHGIFTISIPEQKEPLPRRKKDKQRRQRKDHIVRRYHTEEYRDEFCTMGSGGEGLRAYVYENRIPEEDSEDRSKLEKHILHAMERAVKDNPSCSGGNVKMVCLTRNPEGVTVVHRTEYKEEHFGPEGPKYVRMKKGW